MVVHPYNHVVNSVIIGRVKNQDKGDIECWDSTRRGHEEE
jgi:hypothetical protein